MTRRRWIFINGQPIPADEFTTQFERGPMVMCDLKPYKSMVTGEMVANRSAVFPLEKAG